MNATAFDAEEAGDPLQASTLDTQRKRLPGPSRLGKLPSPQPADIELETALDDYRRTIMQEMYGRAKLLNEGPGAIMPDSVLARIALCGHYNKITSIEDLKRQAPKWASTTESGREMGAEIIEIVLRCVL